MSEQAAGGADFRHGRPISQHHTVRQSYDAVAGEYLERFRDELAGKPLDRALLACLAEQTEDGAPVADLGCGPGHVAAWLADRGVASVGIDLSPAMIAAGRRDYPQVEFRQGDFLGLPATDSEFAAAVAFYSIIHLQPAELGRAFSEIHRVLRPGALSLVAFHIGSEVRHVTEWLGHEVDVDFRFLEPSDIAKAMKQAGFRVEMRLERLSYPREVETRRAYLLARRQPLTKPTCSCGRVLFTRRQRQEAFQWRGRSSAGCLTTRRCSRRPRCRWPTP